MQVTVTTTNTNPIGTQPAYFGKSVTIETDDIYNIWVDYNSFFGYRSIIRMKDGRILFSGDDRKHIMAHTYEGWTPA